VDVQIRAASIGEVDAVTLYRILQLRVDVFVVEQACPYPELDGRDTEPGTRHLWLADDSGGPVAYLRVLDDPGGVRIGRVVTAPHARGRGLAGRLMETALDVAGDRTVRLEAQTGARALYARYGFSVDGPEYVEDGIPHVPMRRDRRRPAPPEAPDGGPPVRRGRRPRRPARRKAGDS